MWIWKSQQIWGGIYCLRSLLQVFFHNNHKIILFYFLCITAECWVNLEKHKPSTYNRYGKSDNCLAHTYIKFDGQPSKCGLYIGQLETNFVYKVSKYSSKCNKGLIKYKLITVLPPLISARPQISAPRN